MSRKLLILLFFILLAAFSQDNEYVLISKFSVENQFVLIDQNGDSYAINNQSIFKHDKTGSKTHEYTSNFYGAISQIDVSDPLRLIVFYKEFNQLVFLDAFFNNLRAPIKLDDLGIQQASVIASAASGGFWVFDAIARKLRCFDASLQEIYYSPDISNLLGTQQEPKYLIEYSNYIYLLFENLGIAVFDRYATYIKTIPVGAIDFFQVTGNGDIMWYDVNRNALIRWDMKYSKEDILVLFDAILNDKPDEVFLINNTIYSIDRNSISLYQAGY